MAQRLLRYFLAAAVGAGAGGWYVSTKKDPGAQEIKNLTAILHENMKTRIQKTPPPSPDNRVPECAELCDDVLENLRTKCKIMCEEFFAEFIAGAKKDEAPSIPNATIRELWAQRGSLDFESRIHKETNELLEKRREEEKEEEEK